MSIKNYKTTKLAKEEARRHIVQIAGAGRVMFSSHALRRMKERNIIINDVLNVLLANNMQVCEGEPHPNGYTYRCLTMRFAVAVGFTVRGDGITVVTVFQAERKE